MFFCIIFWDRVMSKEKITSLILYIRIPIVTDWMPGSQKLNLFLLNDVLIKSKALNLIDKQRHLTGFQNDLK